MAELVYALDSGSSVCKDMKVQLLSPASVSFLWERDFFIPRIFYYWDMNQIIRFFVAVLCAVFFFACSESGSFETCQTGSVRALRELSANTETASFCRTIEGEVSYQFTGRCARKGCFFLYDVDDNGARVEGDSIYLSDASKFPAKWKDSSKVRVVRVTGDYYPERDYECESLSDVECQRAFYVKDVD